MTEASRSSVPAPTAGEQNLAQGREEQRAGRMAIAMECFAQAVDQARASGDRELEIAARRHLAIAHHLRGEKRAALRLCLQSRDLALEIGHDRLAAEALIALGNFLYEEGRITATGLILTVLSLTGKRRLSEILEAAGSGLGKVIRSTVFLKNMDDFAAMNQVYGKYFLGTPPARSTVEVARLPREALVEIDVIALE